MKKLVGILVLGMLAACGTKPSQVALSPKDLRNADEKSACPIFFEKNSICANLEWVDEPQGDKTGELVLKFWGKNTATIDGPYSTPVFKPFIKLWMKMGAGHPSDRPVDLQEESAGIYRARDVHFSMSGPWEIWVQLRQEHHIIEQVKLDIQI